MTTARKVRETALCAMMLVGSVIVLRGSVRHPSELNGIDRAVLRISSPIQGALAGAGRWVRRGFSRYVFVVGAAKENQQLKEENARLKAELLAAQRQAGRERDLEKLLGLSSKTAAETLAAHVVGADTNAYFRVARLRLDRGEGEVKPGMAVLAPEGVVGAVSRVYGGWCDVLLAIDPKSSIDVVVPRTGGKGLLRGAGARDRYRATVEFEAPNDAVKEGDLVVTSGLGGTFPRDFPVGKVVHVGKRDVGLFQEADIEPAVDFTRLDHVMILVAAPPPVEDEETTKQKRAEPARGVVPYR
jgi:rod shape-determining protein MreC